MNFPRLLLVALLLISGVAVQAQTSFNEWDKDNNNYIEKDEFTQKFIDEYFSVWGTTSEAPGIIQEGFLEQSYAGLDTDDDNYLTDEEWIIGFNYFYDDYLTQEEIGRMDVNENGRLEYQEYFDVLYRTDYFTDVDLDEDNYISELELAEFVFKNWDTDDDSVISRHEFNDFKFYYLDV